MNASISSRDNYASTMSLLSYLVIFHRLRKEISKGNVPSTYEKSFFTNYLFPKSRIPYFRKQRAIAAAKNIFMLKFWSSFYAHELKSNVQVVTRFVWQYLENCFSCSEGTGSSLRWINLYSWLFLGNI